MEQETFVGPRKVMTKVIENFKTYGANEVVRIHYEGGYSEIMPVKTFELVATHEPKDYNYIRDVKFTALNKVLYPIIGKCVAAQGEDVETRKAARLSMLQEALAAISEIDMKDSEQKSFFDAMNVEFYGIPNAIMYELSNHFARATNWLFTKDDTEFVPGMDVMYNRTYLEMKKIISDIPKANDEDADKTK